MTKRLSLALALALSIGGCNKKDANDNATPKPTDNTPKTEPAKPPEPDRKSVV